MVQSAVTESVILSNHSTEKSWLASLFSAENSPHAPQLFWNQPNLETRPKNLPEWDLAGFAKNGQMPDRPEPRAKSGTSLTLWWRHLKSFIQARDSRKSRQKMAKNTANFCENRKNHGKDTASNHGPEDHYTVYKPQDIVLTTIMTCSAWFSSVKFCRCSKIQR